MRSPGCTRSRRPARPPSWLGCSPGTPPLADARHDCRAIDFAAVLASAPHGAIVVSNADVDTFLLWYYHYALGERPDLLVLADPLLEFDWYRRNLRAVYPDLAIPDTAELGWLDAIAAANPQRGSVCQALLSGVSALECRKLPKQR